MRTHGSLLLSQTKPEDIPEICQKMGFVSAPLTDINSLSQCVRYSKAMNKAGLKPVFGSTFKVNDHEVIVLARNKAGWQQLLYMFYLSNSPANGANPHLTIDELRSLQTDNIFIISPIDIYMHLDGSEFSFPAIYPRTKNSSCDHSHCVAITPNFFEKEKLFQNTLIRCKGLKTSVENFDNSNEFDYIHSKEDLLNLGIDQDVIDRGMDIFSMIEPVDITNPQRLPDAQIPDGLSQKEYLRKICLEKCPNDPVYLDRLNYELEAIGSADMEGYFIIIQDIVKFITERGHLSGAGRGSAGGCLISYLTGITHIDPIRYNLMFERFYTPDRGSLPDIDLDMPEAVKDPLIEYLRKKYGENRFAQLCTFSTFKAAAALKTVFTATGTVTPSEQNEITKMLPFEGKIADQLEEQAKNEGIRSMLYWTLKNKPKILAKWCTLKNGLYDGVLANEFEEAVKIESVISGRGRHASAFVLSNEPIYKLAPIIYDPVSELQIIGVDMYGAEDLGLAKMDLLGLNLLSKCEYMKGIIRGEIGIIS